MASVLATIIPAKNSQYEHFPGPVVVYPDSEITVGRGSKCTIPFPDIKHISNVHCLIQNKDGMIQIKSVSSNKTLVDGKAINKDEWVRLKDASSIILSQEPRVKLDVRIGNEAITSPGKKRKVSRKRIEAIAEITSRTHRELEYLVIPSSKHSRDISVTVGRAKDCNIHLDNKKISSTHVKLIFSRVEGESLHWDLLVEAVSAHNKTFIGDDRVEETVRIESISQPIDICLVFPRSERPVEVLTITPLFDQGASEEETSVPLTAADMIQQELVKEEKRQRKELRDLEKQSQEWKVEYNNEIQRMQDSEHSLMREMDVLNQKISVKRDDIMKLSGQVAEIEHDMQHKESGFRAQVDELKAEHESRLNDLTNALNQTATELQKLTDEKLKIQMNLTNDN